MINQCLVNYDWSTLYTSFDCNTKVELISDLLTHCIDEFIPKRTAVSNECKPWFTRQLKQFYELRNEAYRI